jgi:hypothetical protein
MFKSLDTIIAALLVQVRESNEKLFVASVACVLNDRRQSKYAHNDHKADEEEK